jgi:hypothetical protein
VLGSRLGLWSSIADVFDPLVDDLLEHLLPLSDLGGGGTEAASSSLVLGMLDSEGICVAK